MNIMVISSLSQQSGSSIRNRGICLGLSSFKHSVEYIEPQRTEKIKFLIAASRAILKCVFLKYDVVLAMKPFPNACIPAILAKYARGSKIILDIDDVEYLYHKNLLIKKLFIFFHCLFPGFFDRVTVHNYALEKFVKEKSGRVVKKESILSLPQGIDHAMFQGVARDLRLEERLGIKGYRVLIYAAHLGVASSLSQILFILKDIARNKKDLKLLIIGGGSHLEFYRNMSSRIGIADKVVFTGYLKHTEVPKYMKLGDVALNYFENPEMNKYRSPIKIREYLALGIPVVCNGGGDSELFSRFIDICPDMEGYKAKILEVLDNPPYSRIDEARQFILRQYDWKECLRHFDSELQRLTKR